MTNDTRTITIQLRREYTTAETVTITRTVRLSELGLEADEWNQDQAFDYAENLVMEGDYPDDGWREQKDIVDVGATEVTCVTLRED